MKKNKKTIKYKIGDLSNGTRKSNKVVTEDVIVKKKSSLFEYIKVLFGKESEWEVLTNYDKAKNAFMINRFMSIKFPTQANLFNKLKTDPVAAAESWRMMGRKYSRVPGFIYTKIKETKKEKVWVPNQNALDLYLRINEIGEREFNEALKLKPDEIKHSIQILEKQFKDAE